MAVDFSGEFTVQAPPREVFAVLADAERFTPLLPTYVSHETRDDGTTDVRVKVGVGKIRGTAAVNLELTESEELRSANYAGKGKVMGGAFNLGAAFTLKEAGANETAVEWHGDLVILGKLVSLAGGMNRPIARKQIQHLIDAIQSALAAGTAAPDSRQIN